MSDGLDLLSSTDRAFRKSSNSKINSMASHQQVDADYSNGVPFARVKRTGRVIKIDVSSTTKIGLFASSGSGKTIFAKAVASRLAETGRIPLNGADVKNDFESLNEPVTKKIRDQLSFNGFESFVDNESPSGIEREVFMPKFLTKHYDSVPTYVAPFTFGFQDISETDFKFLVGAGELTESQEVLLTNVLDSVELRNTSFDELRELVDRAEANHQVKQSVTNRLDSLESKEIISNRYREDPIDFLERGKAVSLGFENWRNYKHGELYKLEFYAALVLRRLKGRAQGMDQDLLYMLPEAHKFAPAGQESLLKGELQDLMDMAGRQMDMPIFLDSQAPSQIPNARVTGPNNFLGRLNHILIGCDPEGGTLDKPEWKAALNATNLYNPHDPEPWRRRLNELEPYDFLYVNPSRHDGPRDCPIVRSLAPLCDHE